MERGFVVAIDGTAGSGKSTTARRAARELGFVYLDTGAMYRAITLKVIRRKLDLADGEGLKAMLDDTEIDFRPDNAVNHVLLDGEDVTEAIRTQEVDRNVSHVSVLPAVRQLLVAQQRRVARGKRVVCEGRDIGSVVFPDADLKFYMEASIDARAERRRRELQGKGVAAAEKSIMDNLSERDYIDSTRAHSPLTRVKDAIAIDTTNITIEEEIMIVVNLVKMRMARKG